MPLKIAFRGDNRPPEQVFLSGFQRRSANRRNQPLLVTPSDAAESITVKERYAVCLSSRLQGGAMFPWYAGGPPSTEPSWLYVVAVDPVSATNVHGLQVAVDQQNGPSRPLNPRWTLYLQEMVVLSVPPTSIIGCVQIRRTWNGGHALTGGTYDIVSQVSENSNCTVENSIRNAALAFLRSEVAEHSQNQLLPLFTQSYRTPATDLESNLPSAVPDDADMQLTCCVSLVSLWMRWRARRAGYRPI